MGVESLLPQSTKRWEPNQKTKQEPMGHHHFVDMFAFDIDIVIVIAIGIVIVLVTLSPLSSSLIYLSTKPTPCRPARELWLPSLAHNEGANRVLVL